MKAINIAESLHNVLDTGVYIQSIKNAFETRFEMGFKTFVKHLIFGKGYKEITPPQLQEMIEKPGYSSPLVIDLRERHKFRRTHIPDAVLHPFDDFLREILVDDGYRTYKNNPIILVCDTGHQSRVAASIMAEEGFLKIVSLKRGMRRWNRWKMLSSFCNQNSKKALHFCRLSSQKT